MGELIASFDNYSIYKSYVNEKDNYYLCIPNGNISSCQIVLGFSDKSLDSLSHDELVAKIKEINDVVYSLNNNSIYAVPNISENELKDAVIENDDRLYINMLNNKIQPITKNIYDMLVKNGIIQKNISQVIHVIKRNETDKKIAGWLAMKLGDLYIKEIDYDELLEEYKLKEDIARVEIGNPIDTGGNIPIVDESVFENNIDYENKDINIDSGIVPVNHNYGNVAVQNKENKLVKKYTKPVDKSPGFSSFKFIIAILLFSLVVGVSIGYLIIK